MNFMKGRKIRGLNKDVFAPFMKKEVAETAVSETAAGEVKETFINSKVKQFKEYLKMVANDYKTVAQETATSCKTNPVRATFYGITIGSFIGLYKTVPTYRDYVDKRKEYANEMYLCGNAYSRKTEYYLQNLDKLQNTDRLEYRSFVFFGCILANEFSAIDQSYEKHCQQLRNPSKYSIFEHANKVLKFLSRVIDFGFMNKWYFLDKHFVDYDIDEREWATKN